MKNKMKILWLVIVFILFASPLHISANEYGNKKESATGRLLFLLDESTDIITETKKPVWVFFSDIKISAPTGPVYAFFSTIETNQPGNYSTFSSTLKVSKELDRNKVRHNSVLPFFYEEEAGEYYISVRDIIPPLIIYISLALINIFVGMSFYAIKPSLSEQSSMILALDAPKALKNGIAGYFLSISLITVFMAGIILFPLALLLILIVYSMSLLGEVGLAMLLGYNILFTQEKQYPSSLYSFLGLFIIEAIKLLPYIGWFIALVLLPIFTMGIFLTNYINSKFEKKYYETPYKIEKQPFAIDDIRDTILGNKPMEK